MSSNNWPVKKLHEFILFVDVSSENLEMNNRIKKYIFYHYSTMCHIAAMKSDLKLFFFLSILTLKLSEKLKQVYLPDQYVPRFHCQSYSRL